MREPASGPPEFGCREWSCQVVGEVQAGLKVSWEAYTARNGLRREQDSIIEEGKNGVVRISVLPSGCRLRLQAAGRVND